MSRKGRGDGYSGRRRSVSGEWGVGTGRAPMSLNQWCAERQAAAHEVHGKCGPQTLGPEFASDAASEDQQSTVSCGPAGAQQFGVIGIVLVTLLQPAGRER